MINTKAILERYNPIKSVIYKNYIYFFILIFLYKSYLFFQEPRLWAEEGSIYFKNSYEKGIMSLFSFHQGYYSIIPNATLYISSLFSYKYIPYFTTTISLLFFLILFILSNHVFESVNKRYNFILFFGIYIMVNSNQEIFLNTINIQFITPIIFFMILLYDFNRLKTFDFVLMNIIVLICLTNGVLSFVLLPIFCYKLMRNQYIKWAFFLISVFMMVNLLAIFTNNQSELESITSRFYCNLDYKILAFKKEGFSSIFKHSYYIFSLVPLIIFSYFMKSKSIVYFISTLVLSIFMDFTTLIPPIHSRYEILINIFIFISLILLLKEYKFGVHLGYVLILVILIKYSKDFFDTSISHDSKSKKWNQEYKNLIYKKKAYIYPNNHVIDLEK